MEVWVATTARLKKKKKKKTSCEVQAAGSSVVEKKCLLRPSPEEVKTMARRRSKLQVLPRLVQALVGDGYDFDEAVEGTMDAETD